MAGVVSIALSSAPKLSLNPPLCSSLSTPFPSKHKRRKNYLRPKILKTLTKPFPSSTPTKPIIPLDPSPDTKPLGVVVFETPSEEIDQVEEFQVSETSGVTGENSVGFGKISTDFVLKFVLGFVGIFMFQTLVAVWMMGNESSQDKDENLNGFQRVNNRSKNGNYFNNGKVGSSSRTVRCDDDSELDEKVNEIRAMAREARETEKKESKNDDEGDMLDEALNSKRLGIEKEIGARLNKLEKKLNSRGESFPGLYTGLLDKLKDGENAKEMNKKLFVKKKFKFIGPGKSSRSGAKGFSGIKKGRKSSNKNDIATSVSRIEEMDDGKTVASQNSDSLPIGGEKIEEEKLGSLNNNTSAGSEITEEWLSPEFMKSIKLSGLDTQNAKIFTKEIQEAKTKSDKRASLRNAKRRDVSNKPQTNKVQVNQSGFITDPWWLELPYVLVILMQRGHDPEGPGGLFTLRISSEDQEKSETSCTVAFENRSDANNLCYLLECFFEDLGNFSAEVVPMSVKELRVVAKSHAKDVIVVKKGQVKLYAGQTFAEVEMALLSLIEEQRDGLRAFQS